MKVRFVQLEAGAFLTDIPCRPQIEEWLDWTFFFPADRLRRTRDDGRRRAAAGRRRGRYVRLRRKVQLMNWSKSGSRKVFTGRVRGLRLSAARGFENKAVKLLHEFSQNCR
jgi:hypothetical protein